MITLVQEKLHRLHIALLVFNTQTGVVVLTLPRTTAKYFGTNGWVTLLITFLIVTIDIMLITWVYKLGHGASVFDILQSSLPRVIYYPLYFFLGCLFSMIGCLVTKQYVMIYQMLIFPSTSDVLLKLVVDILVFLLVIKGLYTMSKANVFFVVFLVLQFPIAVYLLPNFDFVRLTPFLFQGGSDMREGFIRVFGAYMGYELVLFIFPYTEKNNNWLKYIHLGNGFTSLIYLLITLECYGFFNVNELVHLAFPILDMYAYISLAFIERMQNFLYSFFILSILLTGAMYYWTSQEVFSKALPWLPGKLTVFLTMVITMFITYIPKTLIEVENWFRTATIIEIFVSFGLPLLLILLLFIQRGREKSETA
ncbi:GerAB/ArcD/ProY family transporter [Paenibacillus puldeungensis]|uniref:GerAB/ArcD/ProY family transporter n=1 Tax=Paenibacillus puldeungensis TaxID=696536 RepID=A0ABW3RRI9_9BACL